MTHEDASGVVIEPGSYSTRIGVAGDVAPLCVVSSSVLKSGDTSQFHIPVSGSPPPDAEVWTPVVDGVLEDVELAAMQWEHFVSKQIGVELREQPLTITEEPWNTNHSRSKLLQHVFEGLEVPIFQLAKSPLVAAFECSKPTALVVSVGGSVASAVPVVEGVVRSKALTRTPFAGDFVDIHILNQLDHAKDNIVPQYQVDARLHGLETLPAAQEAMKLKARGSDSFHNFQLSRLLDNIKRVCSVVNPVPLKGPEIKGTKSYQLPTGYSLLLGPERYLSAEPLFQPTNFSLGTQTPGPNSLGLSEIVYQSLQKVDAPPEVVNSLASNIVLHGGTSLIPGLVKRLESDLLSMSPIVPKVYHSTKHPVWTGASVFASLSEFHESNWITKQQFEEQGERLLKE